MTKEEAYDFLVSAGYKEPAVAVFGGDRFILGQWLPIGQCKDGDILKTEARGVRVLGEGSCWVTAMRAAGHWQEFGVWKTAKEPAVTGVRQKTVKE